MYVLLETLQIIIEPIWEWNIIQIPILFIFCFKIMQEQSIVNVALYCISLSSFEKSILHTNDLTII